MNTPLQRAAAALRGARRAIGVTGAGISVESGIPDFRSADGLWRKYPPEEYATLDAFLRDPDKVWRLFDELGASFRDVQPNPAHHALADLERMGRLRGIVTQNIDGLHQAAGNTHVIEYHGNTRDLKCVACEATQPFDKRQRRETAPRCACGAPMKPAVVLFGEMIPGRAIEESEALAGACDVVVIVGTSASVYPAAAIPHAAKARGAFIIECNTEATGFTTSIVDVFLPGRAGETLPDLVRNIGA